MAAKAKKKTELEKPGGAKPTDAEMSLLAIASQETAPPKSGIPVISLSDVSVKYKNKQALDHVSFEVFEGEIFALLGSNGAGKSTVLSCISRLNKNYQGSLKILGKEAKSDRKNAISNVAIVPQEYSFFHDFSVQNNLKFACTSFNISGKAAKDRVDFLLAEYQLENFRNFRARHLSGGYKRLLNIAMSVAKEPKIILLDEPTAGLDVDMRRVINGIIRRFKLKGMTVILTTHYLEDVEALCDRLALLSLGKIVAIGNISDLIAEKGGPYVVVLSEISGDVQALLSKIQELENFQKIVPLQDKIYLIASQEKIGACLRELSPIFASNSARIGKIEIREPSLNKVFLGLLGAK